MVLVRKYALSASACMSIVSYFLAAAYIANTFPAAPPPEPDILTALLLCVPVAMFAIIFLSDRTFRSLLEEFAVGAGVGLALSAIIGWLFMPSYLWRRQPTAQFLSFFISTSMFVVLAMFGYAVIAYAARAGKKYMDHRFFGR